LFAEIIEAVWQLAADLVAYGMRHAYAANRRQRLKPIGNVDTIPVNVIWLDNNFRDIDADPEVEAGCIEHSGVPPQHALLDIDRAPDRIYHADELDEHAVPNGFDDAAAPRRYSRVKHSGSMCSERSVGAPFIIFHEAAKAGDVE
jgi:hypothetical protein